METDYVIAFIGEQRTGKTTELKERVFHLLKDDSLKVYIAGNRNEWEIFNENRVLILDEIVYDSGRSDDLKSVNGCLIIFDKPHYTETEKNIIRKICILAPMHDNRVILSLPDFHIDDVWEKTIMKLCSRVYVGNKTEATTALSIHRMLHKEKEYALFRQAAESSHYIFVDVADTKYRLEDA